MGLTKRQLQARKARDASLIARRKRKQEKQAEIELARVKRRKSDPKEVETVNLNRAETKTQRSELQLQHRGKGKVQTLSASQLYFKQLRLRAGAQTGSEVGAEMGVEDTKPDCKLEAEEMNQVGDEEAVPFSQLANGSGKIVPKKLKLRIIAPHKVVKKRKLVKKDVPVPPRKPLPPPPKNCFVCRRLLSCSDASKIDRAHCLFLLNDLMGVPRDQANLHLDQAGWLKNWIGLCQLCHCLIIDGAKDREEIRKLKASIKRRQQLFSSKFRLDLSLKLCGEVNPDLREIQDLFQGKDRPPSPPPDLVPLADHEDDPLLPDPPSPPQASTRTPATDDEVHLDKDELQSQTKEEVPPSDVEPTSEPIDSNDLEKIGLGLEARKPSSTGKFTCRACPGVRKYDVNRFAQHLAIHRRLPSKCSVCHVFLPQDEEQREQHWTDKHPDIQLTPTQDKFVEAKVAPVKFLRCKGAKDCITTFTTEKFRDIHELKCPLAKAMPEKNGQPAYSCSACKNSLRTLEEWRLHRVMNHPEVDRISCLYCDATFGVEGKPRDEEKMLLHIRDHHESDMPKERSRPWKRFFCMNQIFEECEPCGLVFTFGTHARNHFMQKHGGSGRGGRGVLYFCPVCRKGFNSHTGLLGHTERNHFLEESICDLCGESFKWLPNLLDHKLRAHDFNPGEEHPIYACEEPGCQYKTVAKQLFLTHSKNVHAPHGTFKCKYCGKGFKNSAHVKEHESFHENKESKPYQCEICGNSFALRNYLYIHKRLSHEGRIFPSTNKKKGPRKEKKNPKPGPGRLEKSDELNSATSEGASSNNANDKVDCATEEMS